MANETAERILQECHDTALFLQDPPLGVNDTNVLGDTPLHLACHWTDAEGVAALLAAGANVNALGDIGQTPLFRAKSVRIVDLLLAAGADPSIKDEFGDTAELYLKAVELTDIAAHIALQSKR